MDAKLRPGGLAAGVSLAQVEPSQVHVSFWPPAVPPNSTSLPMRGSKAMAAPWRPEGWAAGPRWTHALTARVRSAVAERPAASETRTVKTPWPGPAGTPAIAPVVGLRARPPGGAPEAIDHV